MQRYLTTGRKAFRFARSLSTHNISTPPIFIANGTVVNSDREFLANVLIRNGKIESVTEHSLKKTLCTPSAPPDATVIDARGKYIIPGGIDPHVHLEMPFMGTVSVDGYTAGTRAAVAGGTTCLVDFIIPKKGQDLVEAYEEWSARAAGEAICDYSFHCAITYWDDDKIPRGMTRLVQEKGISSFKVFLAYKGTLQVEDEAILKILQNSKRLGAVTMAHCENADMVELGQQQMREAGVTGPEGHYWSRIDECEAEATHRMITLAHAVNAPLYVVHVMSELAADEVARGRQKGCILFGETLASTLGVDGRQLSDPNWRHAAGYVMSPPLNPDPNTKTQLMKRLSADDLQVVSTDNCTFRTDQKLMGKNTFTKIPNGVNGIEDRLAVVWTNGVKKGLLTPSDFVRTTSTNAAQIFNMYPRKGVIQAGADADVVVWDGEAKRTISRHTHHHAVDFNIFEGMEVQGIADTTISGGVIKWRHGLFTNEDIEKYKGTGRLVEREAFGHSFSRVANLDSERNPAKIRVERETSSDICLNEAVFKDTTNANEHEPPSSPCGEEQKDVSAYLPACATSPGEFVSVEETIMKYVTDDSVRDELLRVLYASSTSKMTGNLPPGDRSLEATTLATQYDFDVCGVYDLKSSIQEQIRSERIVRVAAIQNSIVKPTSAPIAEQKQAIMDKIEAMLTSAALMGANVACLQECWTSPFFMCTRERYPWIEFAEDPYNGDSTQLIKRLAKKHNMVILSPILEKEQARGVLHNTCVVIDNHGECIGIHRKNHIPRVGDFNESSYYGEGNTGHPVFDTEFGKIAVNICYGRHHPLNWMAFGLNGAEIVFNPSATVHGLSEHLWGLEARTAAIANSYYSVAINRVGTETFPNAFTSGDGKPAHKEFGHFYGSSFVTSPSGQRTPGLSRTRDGLLLTDIDLNMCDQLKQTWQFPMTSRLKEYADFMQDFCKTKLK